VTTYWFKPKRYGYGATPVTWQGWAFVLGFLLIVLGCVGMGMVAERHNSPGTALGALLLFAVALAVMILVSRRKTEGGWRWRWGGE
jgi:multisubunit Na+/H+ antiporter MnhB subunit